MSSMKISDGFGRETLEERLAKRRQFRNKRMLLDRTSFTDESDRVSTNCSPIKTQSLDRKSSARRKSIYTPVKSVKQHRSSSIINENLEPISKGNSSILLDRKNDSTPLLPQLSKTQYFDLKNEKQSSSKPSSSSTAEQQVNERSMINTNTISSEPLPVIPSTSIEQSNSIPQEIHKYSPSHHHDKPSVAKENDASILPPIISRSSTDKLNSITKETYENPNLKRSKEHSHTASSNLQPSTDRPKESINVSLPNSKPIARMTSEQIVSKHIHRDQLNDVKYPKMNTLAMPYLFHKSMLEAESARLSSCEYEQAQKKTVWD